MKIFSSFEEETQSAANFNHLYGCFLAISPAAQRLFLICRPLSGKSKEILIFALSAPLR